MIQVYHKKLEDVWYGAAVEDVQVVSTCFSVKEPSLNLLLSKLPKDTVFEVLDEPNQLQAKVLGALDEVFKGRDNGDYGFRVANNKLSVYAVEGLKCTRLVPVGYVTSYGAIAKAVGGSARSVGQVEASNPFPLLVPCHRVVCSDLSIGGYGYGQQLKQQILRRECRGYEESTSLKTEDGKELALFPAEWVKQKQGELLRV